MKNLTWKVIAYIVSRPIVYIWLVDRAMRTPYLHLEGYMKRWWLFNAYTADHYRWWSWLPSIRIHHILRADLDWHHHDHPWNARTIIFQGAYAEERLFFFGDTASPLAARYTRFSGDTATLKYGEYHRITNVSDEGVWTLFITWKYQGTWGYLVDGVKVPWRDYHAKP